MFEKTRDGIIEIIKKLNSEDNNFCSIFISPAGYTLIMTHYEKNKKKLSDLSFSDTTNSFLNSLGFFNKKDYNISELKRNQILPLKTINSQDGKDIEEISNEFYNILSEFLGENNKSLTKNISSMVGELLNNISNHSGIRDIGDNTGEVIISSNFQSGQYYYKKKFIQISIVDSGKGIFSSVRKKIPKIKNTEEAIKKALEPGFTGGTTLEDSGKNYIGIYNAGIGLTTTLDIIKKLKGDLFIGTKDCLFCYNGSNNEESFLEINKWLGTFIVFNIYIDRKTEVNFDELRIQLLGNTETTQDFDINIDFG